MLSILLLLLGGCENQADFGRAAGGGGDVVVSDVPIMSIQSTNYPDLSVPEGEVLAFKATITPALKEEAQFLFGLIGETATISSTRNLITFADVNSPTNGSTSSGEVLPIGTSEFLFSVKTNVDSIYEPGGETFFIRFLTDPKILRLNSNLYDDTVGGYRQRVTILDDDPKPAVGFTDISTKTASEAEGFASLTVGLKPNLTNGAVTLAGSNIKIPVTYTPITSTLSPLTDFTQIDYVIFAPEKATADFKFLINDDAVAEGMESMRITLGTPFNADLIPAFGEVIVNILDDDSGGSGLTGTGVISCAPTDCTNADYPMQNGHLPGTGFNFTKIDSSGFQLSDLATTFSCARDNNTNLMWEVKVYIVDSVQNPQHKYTWFDTRANSNGGDAGNEGSTAGCALTTGCNTQSYIDEINKLALCGKTTWRLPKLQELVSLMDVGSDTSDNQAITSLRDVNNNPIYKPVSLLTNFFPNIGYSLSRYWSATPVAGFKDKAWSVTFSADPQDPNFNFVIPEDKASALNVRLVASD